MPTQEDGSRYAVARTRSTVTYRRKRRLNRIVRWQMLPVVSREVVEREHAFAVLLQCVRGLRILGRLGSSRAGRTQRARRRELLPSRLTLDLPWRDPVEPLVVR
jgi:hypothetical protein